jgi:hypothetical protein
MPSTAFWWASTISSFGRGLGVMLPRQMLASEETADV